MMKTNINKFVLLCGLILFYTSVFSQSNDVKKNGFLISNNIIHISLAPDIAYNAAAIYYDRIISQNDRLATFVRVGFGGWHTLLVDGGTNVIGQGGIILGSNNKRFEASAGVAYQNKTANNNDDPSIIPAISLGIRSQKPNKHFVFRAGLGYPEGIYVGFGYAL